MRWRCYNYNCLSKAGWWRSIHHAVFCLSCCPPSLPDVVAATGTMDDAPEVLDDLGTTPADAPKPAFTLDDAFLPKIPGRSRKPKDISPAIPGRRIKKKKGGRKDDGSATPGGQEA